MGHNFAKNVTTTCSARTAGWQNWEWSWQVTVFLWQMRIERARRWLSLAASVGSRNWPFLFFVAPATRQNRTRDEEQSRLRRKSLQLSCSVCISFWGANKHSCLNKVVGTMPGPIGWAEGIGVGGIALHIQFASLFLSARCYCLAV